MNRWRWALVGSILGMAISFAPAAEPATPAKTKKLLLVTHSGGFMHDSIGVAEDILKEKGPNFGFETTCFRFTGNPEAKVKWKKTKDAPEVEVPILEKYSADYRARTGKTVEKEHCGRINAETLKKFDCVLFFTTGNPMTKDELKDLQDWVKAGGAFTGTHCATDTMYSETSYGDLIGAYFRTHPPGFQKVKVKVEDPKHPAAAGFTDGIPYEDEIYIFKDSPYDRDKLRIIFSIHSGTFDPKNNPRTDNDYAISWCKDYGQGKVFYTSLGHKRDVWKDENFQKHLFGGLKWATGVEKGESKPSGKPK